MHAPELSVTRPLKRQPSVGYVHQRCGNKIATVRYGTLHGVGRALAYDTIAPTLWRANYQSARRFPASDLLL